MHAWPLADHHVWLHYQMTTREQRGSLRGRALAWSTLLLALQLLLILAPFVLILCAPALLPNLPKLGSHPTAFPKVNKVYELHMHPLLQAVKQQ